MLIRVLFPWPFRAYQQFQFHKRAFIESIEIESTSSFVMPEILFRAAVNGLRSVALEAEYHARTGGSATSGRLRWVAWFLRHIVRLWSSWQILGRPIVGSRIHQDAGT